MTEDQTPSVEELRKMVGGDRDPDVDVFITNFFEQIEENATKSPLDVQRETLKTYVRPVDGARWALVGERDGKFLIQEQHNHRARLINDSQAVICDHVNSDPDRTKCGWSASLNHPFAYQVGCMLYFQSIEVPIGTSLTDGEIAAIRDAQGYKFGLQ